MFVLLDVVEITSWRKWGYEFSGWCTTIGVLVWLCFFFLEIKWNEMFCLDICRCFIYFGFCVLYLCGFCMFQWMSLVYRKMVLFEFDIMLFYLMLKLFPSKLFLAETKLYFHFSEIVLLRLYFILLILNNKTKQYFLIPQVLLKVFWFFSCHIKVNFKIL